MEIEIIEINIIEFDIIEINIIQIDIPCMHARMHTGRHLMLDCSTIVVHNGARNARHALSIA